MKKIRKQAILLILTLIFAVTLCSAVSASYPPDIYVSPTGDDVTGDGSQGNPFQTIQRGFNVVTGNGSGVVHLAEGTYNKSINSSSRDYGITLDKNVTIIGAGKDKSIIDALNDEGIFSVSTYCIVTLKDLTLKNGNSSMGGAIYSHGNVTATNCAFINNEADAGGAIYACYDGALTLNGCTFAGNTARDDYGGGYGGAINNNAASTITGCIFTGNSAAWGGAIYNSQPCTCTITGCNFNKNTATNSGGAIFSSGNEGPIGATIVKYSRFVGNTAGDSGQDIHAYTGDRDDDPELIATLNWWGSNSGPAAGRITISMGTLIPEMYSPWLMMNILPADASTIYTGQNSKITVNVYTDSNGIDHSGDAAQFFSGPEVTFTTNLGNVGSKNVTVPWTLGMAYAILRGDEGAGIATVTAADGEIVSTTVTILQGPTVNAETVGMQKTGLPIAGLILAVLAVFGGLVTSKRK